MTSLQTKLLELGFALMFLGWCYWWVSDNAVENYKDKVAAEQAKADSIQREKYNKLSEDFEALKSKRQDNAKVIREKVETVVNRDVYRNVCLDDDGLRIINEAIKGANSGELKTEMPSAPVH